MEIKFYFCDHCKNVAIKVVDHKVPLFCCGEKMTELVPGTVDAAVEKHLPEYTVKNGIVSVHVGSVEHPMTPEHYISLIAVQTDRGVQYKNLTPRYEKVLLPTFQELVNMRSRGIDMMSL